MAEENNVDKVDAEEKVDVTATSVKESDVDVKATTVKESDVDVKATSVKGSDGDDTSPKTEQPPKGESAGKSSEGSYDRRPNPHGRRSGGGRGYQDPRYMSNDEKLKLYKKQSEERLLDIKRSREAKIGKRRAR